MPWEIIAGKIRSRLTVFFTFFGDLLWNFVFFVTPVLKIGKMIYANRFVTIVTFSLRNVMVNPTRLKSGPTSIPIVNRRKSLRGKGLGRGGQPFCS